MEVLSLVVTALLKDGANVLRRIVFKPGSQELYSWLGGIWIRQSHPRCRNWTPGKARKENVVQSVAAGRESTGKKGPYPGETTVERYPWKVSAKRRRARAGAPESFKGYKRAEKNTRDLWHKRIQDFLKIFFFPTHHLFLCTQPFPVSKPLCFSSFTHKTSGNNTLKSLHVRRNSTPLWVNTSHCAL